MEIKHRFKPGDEVLVLHPSPKYGPDAQPTPAVIVRVDPYRHPRGGVVTPGYYVSYPGAKEQWDCHGGWVMASSLRGTEKSTCV